MKKLFGIILCLCVFASASMIGLDALGEEQVLGGMAGAAGRGYAGSAKTGEAEGFTLMNPARIAFDTKVVFNVNFEMEWFTAEKSSEYFTTNKIAVPSFNLTFPMGNFGALGVSLWQRYTSTLRESVKDSVTKTTTDIEYQGSVYEIVPTYAVRIPYLRNFSLGASAHLVMGNISRSLTMGPDNSAVSKEDSWATNNLELSDYVEGTWEVNHHPAYYSFAMQYRGKQVSYFFSYTMAHTLLNELEYNFRFSQLDTLAPTEYSREIEVPAMLATGINYRLFKRHNIMMDLSWRAWDEDVENIGRSYDMRAVTKTQNDFMASLGYQWDGTGLFYDPYWKRITYRAGGWYKNWYIEDVYEFGGSVGVGLPLGRKGTTIDLAFQGGKRMSESKGNWEESFVGVRLGLMGVSSWGQTHR
ncbi:MAG: hypothetical protein MJY78_01705 [Fibrobacter sp.]|nr:hypothetical protein [Fibrobacter sp.]